MNNPTIKVLAEDGSIIEEREMTNEEYSQFLDERDKKWAES